VLVTTSSFMNRLPIHTLGQLWVVAAVYTCLSQTHLMSKIVRSHPRFAGPDLMQPAIRLQESEFPETGPSLPITVQIFTTTHMGFGIIFMHKAK
jgi:hypothetical protein